MLKKIISLCMVLAIGLSANSFEKDTYITGKIKVEGESAPNQNRYSAIRAAKMDAQRNLLQVIGGLKLTSTDSMKNGILIDDRVATTLSGYLRGATVLKKEYNKDDGSAIVTLGIGYLDSASKALAKAKDTGVLEKTLYKDEKPVYYKPNQNTQPSVSSSNDSLIVDVRGLEFEPASVNRIYFNHKIIYDPLIVPSDIISQRGLAKYTTTLNKARAIAESYGSSKPLVVKAAQIARLSSDVKVSQDDAVKITTNNVTKGFLESAKVIFVVD